MYFGPPKNKWWFLCLLQSCPTKDSKSGQDGCSMTSKIFRRSLWWQGQLTLIPFAYLLHTTHFCLLPTSKNNWSHVQPIQERCMYYHIYFRSLQGIATAGKIYIQVWHCLASNYWSPQNINSKYERSSTISAKSSKTCVKKGAKLPCKRDPPVGILHHVSDWDLLANLNTN